MPPVAGHVLQGILEAASQIGRRHGVSIANVATRWVLDHPAVAGVIVGARLGESEHRADNLKLFDFSFDDEDRAAAGSGPGCRNADPGRLRR